MKNKLIALLSMLLSYSITTFSQESVSLFNGKTLDGWEVTDLEGHGRVTVKDSCIILDIGNDITGINWLKEFPGSNYEITLEANRMEGTDFFCALTFPVKGSFLTLVVGGWRGSIVGLSSIDGYDAANNSTGQVMFFDNNKWYPIRLRVTDDKVEAWINNDKLVDFTIGNYRLGLRMEMQLSIPVGFATYQTKGALRNIKMTPITE